MKLTERKLLAILSLELLLYTAVFLPAIVVAMLTVALGGQMDQLQRLALGLIIFGLPLLGLLTNGLIGWALVKNARQDESARKTMKTGLKLLAGQAALFILALFDLYLVFLVALIAIGGLVTAALMGPETSSPT